MCGLLAMPCPINMIKKNMAESHRIRSSSESEEEVLVNMAGLTIQPYQFEPEYESGEVSSDGLEEAGGLGASEHDPAEEQTTERVGHIDWCECGGCLPMPTALESRCCKEVPIIWEKYQALKGTSFIISQRKCPILL